MLHKPRTLLKTKKKIKREGPEQCELECPEAAGPNGSLLPLHRCKLGQVAPLSSAWRRAKCIPGACVAQGLPWRKNCDAVSFPPDCTVRTFTVYILTPPVLAKC